MKKLLLVLFVISFAFQLNGYDKKPLVERFTNTSCGPCATLNNGWYNATTKSLVTAGSIAHIVYNVSWPSSSDPMYLLNSTDNMARRVYYSVQWVPWININGTQFDHMLGQTAFLNIVNTANPSYSPFNIEIIQEEISENLIKFDVKIIRDPDDITVFGNIKLRVALTEKTVAFASPPGSNGESEFFSVCRKMLPDANGSTFTIPDPGGFVELSLQYVPTASFLQAVNLDSLSIVAFIQDDGGTKELYQSNIVDAVIPVELTSFTAQVIYNNVELNWTTATELNNQGFYVERSQKSEVRNQDWEVIGFVAGYGTTTEQKSYSFADDNITTGIYAYRLKQIDFDGTFEYSNGIEVDVDLTPTEYTLNQNYPNPFNPTTAISYAIPKADFVTLKIYDMLGNEVAVLVNEERPVGTHTLEFNSSGIASGTYFYRIIAGEFTETRKMILLK